jgi:hypothetical protein
MGCGSGLRRKAVIEFRGAELSLAAGCCVAGPGARAGVGAGAAAVVVAAAPGAAAAARGAVPRAGGMPRGLEKQQPILMVVVVVVVVALVVRALSGLLDIEGNSSRLYTSSSQMTLFLLAATKCVFLGMH